MSELAYGSPRTRMTRRPETSNGARIRTLVRGELPDALYEIPGPPGALWLRGALPSAGTKYLAVVGSRALSDYGREACERLIAGLAGYPVSIVSGLALGADACAHRAALKAGLHTIAIPGSGITDKVIGPRANLGLARDILKAGGALISEHEGDYLAHPYDFPSRNRIMAGMADAILVIEAGTKSGTLITARLAGEYGKELLVVPHRIGDPHGYGAHLFSRLGAAVVTESLHLLEALHIAPREDAAVRPEPRDLSAAERAVWQALAEPKARDEVLRASGSLGPHELLTALISLELAGYAREEFGLWRRT